METWILFLILLDAKTGAEISVTPVNEFESMTMCTKGAMALGPLAPQKDVVIIYRCTKTEYAHKGWQS